MPSQSAIEQALAAAETALAGVCTTISRDRVDGFSDEELPAINIKRADADFRVQTDRLQIGTAVFSLECQVAVAAGWSTAADALHVAADTALAANATLAGLVRGLRCTGISMAAEAGEYELGRLTANYQFQFSTRPGDLTRAIT